MLIEIQKERLSVHNGPVRWGIGNLKHHTLADYLQKPFFLSMAAKQMRTIILDEEEIIMESLYRIWRKVSAEEVYSMLGFS